MVFFFYYKQKLELEYYKKKDEIEYEYYKDLIIKEDEINKIKHDLRNELQVIYKVKNKDEKLKLINKIDRKINNSSITKYTSNRMLNMLLNIKKNTAIDKNINIDINVKNDIIMDEIDMISIVSNILDNAIKYGDNISFVIDKKMDNIYIYSKNDINSNIPYGSKYGLKIIKDIVNKYNGSLKYETKDNIFEIIIMMEEK